MGILNVNQIQPVGSGQTVTISATNISAGSATVTAGTFSGGVAVTSGNLTGITSVSTTNLKVDTIQDQAGGNASTPDEIYSGRAKAWVNFNGSGTVAIRSQFNVSSITDHGTGNYSTNFSSALPNSNYAAFGGHGGTNASTIRMADAGPNLNSGGYNISSYQTTTSLRFLNGLGSSSVPYDADYISIAIFTT